MHLEVIEPKVDSYSKIKENNSSLGKNNPDMWAPNLRLFVTCSLFLVWARQSTLLHWSLMMASCQCHTTKGSPQFGQMSPFDATGWYGRLRRVKTSH